MKKAERGKPGYLKSLKMKYLVTSLIEFAIVAAVFALGYFQTGSRLNLLTVVAVLGCLPASKNLVEFIVVAPHKGIAVSKYEEIEEKAPTIIKVYDLVVAGQAKLMQLDAVAISGSTVCGYASSEKTDEVKLAEYLKKLFASNGYDKITVKIFHDYKAFLARAEGMNSIAVIDKPSISKRERKLRSIIYNTSL